MEPEQKKIKQIYEYLSAETQLARADGAFVFCRADPLVAQRASDLYHNHLVNYIMFTGGIGKDSGDLQEKGFNSEVEFQKNAAMYDWNVPAYKIFTETQARNGGENCRNGIDLILASTYDGQPLAHDNLIVVCHATSLRRVTATLETEVRNKNFATALQKAATKYNFDPKNPTDYKEAVAELLRLADWPAKGWCEPQADMPLNLVDYARVLDRYWATYDVKA